MSINRTKDNNKKTSRLCRLFFFEITEESILVDFPYCPQNELVARQFHQFTNKNFQVTIKWITKKVKSLFSLKDKNPYSMYQVYKKICVWLLVKQFRMLTFDVMRMRTYARNLNLQNI